MKIDDIKSVVEIIQAIVTSLGVIAAGIWSFYVFVLGRNYQENVHLQISLKQILKLQSSEVAIISIVLKNIGKTKVEKKTCACHIASIPNLFLEENRELDRLDPPNGQIVVNGTKHYELFRGVKRLEPDEPYTEDILFDWGNSPIIKVYATFQSKKNPWSANAIFTNSGSPSVGEPKLQKRLPKEPRKSKKEVVSTKEF